MTLLTEAPTLTELHDALCHRLVWASPAQLDYVSSVDVQIHNTLSVANSMSWEFDLKSMWLTPSRWTMMVNQYLDSSDVEAWDAKVDRVGSEGRGIAVLRTKTVAARGGAATGHTNKETRRWGSCMLALSYKAVPRPQISLYSRTSYLGYIGALDLTVAWVLARRVADRVGLTVEDLRFVWFNEALQWHNFKSLAYLLNHPDEDQRRWYRKAMLKPWADLKPKTQAKIESSPAMTLTRKWISKLQTEDEAGKTYGDMTYNTYRRIRRRYHTEVFGMEYARQFEGWSHYKVGPRAGEEKEFFKAYLALPHCFAQNLDLRALGL